MNRWVKNGYPVLAALALTGCGMLSGKQSGVDPDGPVAQVQYQTFLVTLWISVALFAVVGGLFLLCLVKFRAPGGEVAPDYPLPDQSHGNPLLEIGVIFVSLLLIGIMAVPTVYGILYAGTLPEGQKPLIINVTGQQFWWKFEYPELGVVTANEAAIPVGRPVRFNLQTLDVIHSFWIPRLGGKMDLTPGQDNWFWLQADKPGSYWGQCTEFCGQSHAFMRMRVIAQAPDDFDQWVVDQKKNAVAPPPPIFSKGQCAACHTIRGTYAMGTIGPDLTHVGSRTTIAAGIHDNSEENLRQWVHDPESWKPGNKMFKDGYQVMWPAANFTMDDAGERELAKYLTSLK